jgi:hypothetical protein
MKGLVYRLNELIQRHRSVKVTLTVFAKLKKYSAANDDFERKEAHFTSKLHEVSQLTNINNVINDMIDEIYSAFDNSGERTTKSGWTLESIEDMQLRFARYSPLTSGMQVNAPPCG